MLNGLNARGAERLGGVKTVMSRWLMTCILERLTRRGDDDLPHLDHLDHLHPNLLIWHVVQDLNITHPTQETWPRTCRLLRLPSGKGELDHHTYPESTCHAWQM